MHDNMKDVPVSEQMRLAIIHQNGRWTDVANLLRCHAENVVQSIQHLQRQLAEKTREVQELKEKEAAWNRSQAALVG